MKNYWIWRILKGIVFVAVAIFLMGYIVMTLWNHLMPELFGWHTIVFGQAIGLLILCKILFGGFRGGWRGGCCGGGGGWHRHGHWRKRWEEKLASMSPEEREKLKSKWGNCGYWGEDPKTSPPSNAQ